MQEEYVDTPLNEEPQGVDVESLSMLSMSLSKKRLDWVKHRAQSGIEEEWDDIEAAYDGYDEQSVDKAWKQKPPGQYPRRSVDSGDTATRSKVYLNITAPYVDSAAARLMPAGSQIFGIEPSPIPEFPPEVVQQLEAQGVDPEAAKASMVEMAKKKAEAAEKQIKDWTGAYLAREIKEVVRDACKVGTGILKGPYPVKRNKRVVQSNNGVTQLSYVEEIVPRSCCVSYRDIYPDPSCGDNIQDGEGIFEKGLITAKGLLSMVGTPGVFEEQIRKCLQEGPIDITDYEYKVRDDVMEGIKKGFTFWYFHGQLDKDMMIALGGDEESDDIVDVCICMVNHRIVKLTLNTLQSGEYPYDFFRWKRRAGSPWGTGVGNDVHVPQRIIVSGTRMIMDNSGLSAGPMWGYLDGVVEPITGKMQLAPRKGFKILKDTGITDVRQALQFFTVPSVQQELMGVIQFALRMAQDISNLPAILQGQLGDAPDTVGGLAILNKNAGDFLMSKGGDLDDTVITPHISRHYDWILQNGPEEAQGDLEVVAKAAVMAERALYTNDLFQLSQLIADPRSGVDFKKYVQEVLVSKRIDPDRVYPSQDAPPEEVPNPQAMLLQAKMQLEAQKLQLGGQISQAQLMMQAREHEDNTALQQQKLELEAEKAQLENRLREAELLIKSAEIEAARQAKADEQLVEMQKFRDELSVKVQEGSGI